MLKIDPNWSQPSVSLNETNHKMREMLEISERISVIRNGKKVTVKLISQAPAFSQTEFKLKKGDEVTLILTNLDKVEDLTNGFAILKYNVNFIVNPQETASVSFVADKPGVFWCYCTHFCHALHLEMRTRMIVEA